MEALPPLYFPVCGGSEKAKEKETARKREKKRELRKIEMMMMTISKEDRSTGNMPMDYWMSVFTPRA